MSNNKKSFWEGLIFVIIILAIAEIFVEELSKIGDVSISFRKSLIIINFIFDSIFTVEFIIRSIIAPKQKGWVHYFLFEKGWIDFFSSIPLLFFSSGPILLGLFFPGTGIILPFMGLLNNLKLAKMLRVIRSIRLLRLLRVLKIFRKSSVPTSNVNEAKLIHLGRMISISIVAITFVLIVSPFFPSIFYNMDNTVKLRTQKYIVLLQDWYRSIRKNDFERIKYLNFTIKNDPNVLYMYSMGRPVINNLGINDSPYNIIPQKYLYTDYKVLRYLKFKLWYSIKDIVKNDAKINLMVESMIVILIIFFFIFYKERIKPTT